MKTNPASSEMIISRIHDYWESTIIPTLSEYIEIPAQSPAFDSEWKKNGHLERVLALVDRWIEDRNIEGLKKEILQVAGRTPLLVLKLAGTVNKQVLMYGHLDKQPEMKGWSEGLGPWKAVRRENKLYGRGGADDGYAVFASLCVIEMMIAHSDARPHLTVAIEFSEESGSVDLPFYFENYADRFGSPDLVICLDSGAGNYNQLWTTTSLRGLVNGILKVEVLKEGIHSGDGSGIVPNPFRIARLLLDRLENPLTGEIFPTEFKVEIPSERLKQAEKAASVLKEQVYEQYPFASGVNPVDGDLKDLVLNRTWRAGLAVTGAEGLPLPEKAGNVLLPYTELKLSLRLPPTLDSKKAAAHLQKLLTQNPPYGARIVFTVEDSASGWNAPATLPSLENLLQESSQLYFGAESVGMGEGGSIPFIGMLGECFPKAQFVITGVLGPQSNAHGPNEFLEIEFAKKLTACIYHVLSGMKQF